VPAAGFRKSRFRSLNHGHIGTEQCQHKQENNSHTTVLQWHCVNDNSSLSRNVSTRVQCMVATVPKAKHRSRVADRDRLIHLAVADCTFSSTLPELIAVTMNVRVRFGCTNWRGTPQRHGFHRVRPCCRVAATHSLAFRLTTPRAPSRDGGRVFSLLPKQKQKLTVLWAVDALPY
jgi:hypothetical protein